MKKILIGAVFALFLLAPQAHAITWQDAIGNTDFDCAGGFFMFAGNGHGEVTVSTRNAFIFVFEQNAFYDFERKGKVKSTESMESWTIPGYLTRFRLQTGETSGTVTLNGQNRVLVFGRRDGINLSGNYQFREYTLPVSCTPPSDPPV